MSDEREHEDVPLIEDEEERREAMIAAVMRLYQRLVEAGKERMARGIYFQEDIATASGPRKLTGQFIAMDPNRAEAGEWYLFIQRRLAPRLTRAGMIDVGDKYVAGMLRRDSGAIDARPAMTAEVAEMAQRLNPRGILRTTTAPMSTSNDTHIILDKELRRDIDAIIQRLKTATMAPIENGEGFHGEPTEQQLEEWNRRSEERARNHRFSEERKDAIKSLQLAVMWLGMDLKAINDEVGGAENPYPHSKDPSNTTIDPTADGLKL